VRVSTSWVQGVTVQRPQMWVLFENALLFYCMLYTDYPDGIIDAAARHVSFACTRAIRKLSGFNVLAR